MFCVKSLELRYWLKSVFNMTAEYYIYFAAVVFPTITEVARVRIAGERIDDIVGVRN